MTASLYYYYYCLFIFYKYNTIIDPILPIFPPLCSIIPRNFGSFLFLIKKCNNSISRLDPPRILYIPHIIVNLIHATQYSVIYTPPLLLMP